jgi:transposase
MYVFTAGSCAAVSQYGSEEAGPSRVACSRVSFGGVRATFGQSRIQPEDQPCLTLSRRRPADVHLWVSLDVHKLSIVAATLPPAGGQPEVASERAAIRRFIDRLGGPEGLAVCYEAGPGRFDLLRVLTELGVACAVVAPSLIPVRAGYRIKTDRRDAKTLVRLYRGGQLSYVQPPSPQTVGLRDLMRCRDDLRCTRTAARHRVSKQLPTHGRVYRDGKSQWTLMHRAWIARQRLDDELAHAALR